MGGLLLMVGFLVVAIIGAVFARDIYLRKHDMLSWKHLFLAGFVVFFGTGLIFTVIYDIGSELHVASDNAKGIMAMATMLFLILFLAFFALGMRFRLVDKIVPKIELPKTTPGVLISLAATLGLVVASLAFPATGESFTAALASFFRGGMSVTAAGLATYWLLTQKFNPISWAVFAGTLGICLIASIAGESGRRQLLGVLMVVPWVWYYLSLRNQPIRSWAPKAGVLLAAGFVLLVGYSGIRASLRTSNKSIGDLSRALMESATSADLSRDSLGRDLFYQDAATNSMFIIDTYGELYRQRPFNGLVFVLSNPIPRSMWPEKPEALGFEISRQLNVQANLGPGIIGHGWAEAGWIGVIYYAAFFGLVFGAADRLLQTRADNPYFVIVAGSAIGQLIAMSRGDTPLFFLQSFMTMGFSMVVLYGCKMAFGTIMAAFPQLSVGPNRRQTDDQGADEDADADLPDAPQQPESDDWSGESDWGQASAGWQYSEPDAGQGRSA